MSSRVSNLIRREEHNKHDLCTKPRSLAAFIRELDIKTGTVDKPKTKAHARAQHDLFMQFKVSQEIGSAEGTADNPIELTDEPDLALVKKETPTDKRTGQANTVTPLEQDLSSGRSFSHEKQLNTIARLSSPGYVSDDGAYWNHLVEEAESLSRPESRPSSGRDVDYMPRSLPFHLYPVSDPHLTGGDDELAAVQSGLPQSSILVDSAFGSGNIDPVKFASKEVADSRLVPETRNAVQESRGTTDLEITARKRMLRRRRVESSPDSDFEPSLVRPSQRQSKRVSEAKTAIECSGHSSKLRIGPRVQDRYDLRPQSQIHPAFRDSRDCCSRDRL